MTENKYQADLIKEIRSWNEDIFVFPMDGNVYQGYPDILILCRDKYAVLEVKVAKNSEHQPNQDWYIEYMNQFVFASFIWPEIEQEVLYDLQHALLS